MNSTNPFDKRKEKFLEEFNSLEDISIGNKIARKLSKKKKNYKRLNSLNQLRNEQNEQNEKR